MKFSKSIQRLVDRASRLLELKSAKPAPRKRSRVVRGKGSAAERAVAVAVSKSVRPTSVRKSRPKREATTRRASSSGRLTKTVRYDLSKWQSLGRGRHAMYVSDANGSTQGTAIVEPPSSEHNQTDRFAWYAEHEYDGRIAKGSETSLPTAKREAELVLRATFGK